MQTSSFEQRVQYNRLPNGMDVYVLRGSSPDVVIAEFLFPGGAHVVYDMPVVAGLLEYMLPGSIKRMKREVVLETFDRHGATVSISSEDAYLSVHIACRRAVFADVLRLVFEVLTTATLPSREYEEALVHMSSSLVHARENTKVRAQEMLMGTLYQKGHPHWSPSVSTLLKMVGKVTRQEVCAYYARACATVGSIACIVGDVDPEATQALVQDVCGRLPQTASLPTRVQSTKVGDVRESADILISLPDKVNVDTYIGIPTLLTRDASDQVALQVGVQVFGGGATARLFHELRTKQSLTYGAYAGMRGLADGYPGYLVASAVFPHDVFERGRTAFREVLKTFITKGITTKELTARKEEIRGKHVVGLSTTSGLHAALMGTVRAGRSVRYLDEYLGHVDALTVRMVNEAIATHLSYDQSVLVAAGAIDTNGTPFT
jgi:zinc protease